MSDDLRRKAALDRLLWWDVREYSEAAKAYLGITAHNSDPEFDQEAFVFGDPGPEATHTLDTQGADRTVQEDGNGNYAFFLRFGIAQTLTNADQNLTTTFKIQYRHTPVETGTPGSWTDITASSSFVQVVDNASNADGIDTTERITGGTGTFIAGAYDEGDGTFDAITWDPGTNNREQTELVSSLQVIDADMDDGDILDFRIVESDGTVLDVYSVADATLTWEAPAAPAPSPIDSRFHTPHKPDEIIGAFREDGIWEHCYAVFPHFKQAPLWEYRMGHLGQENTAGALSFERRKYGHAWAVATGGDRLTWNFDDPNVFLNGNVAAPRPEWGVTVACLVETQDTLSIPDSTSLIQSYQGVAGSYAWRMEVLTSNQVVFEIDGAGDQLVSAAVDLPAGEAFWAVGRWKAGGQTRVQLFQMDGQPITNEGVSSVTDAGPIDYDGSVGANYIALWGDSTSTWEDAGYYAVVFNKSLTKRQLNILFADPYDFIAPIQRAAAATPGQVTDAASTRIQAWGEVTDAASTRIALYGEVTDLGSTRIAVHGQATDAASTRIKAHGEVTDAASTRIAVYGEVTDLGSTRIAVHGQATDAASTRIKAHGEVTDAASIRIAPPPSQAFAADRPKPPMWGFNFGMVEARWQPILRGAEVLPFWTGDAEVNRLPRIPDPTTAQPTVVTSEDGRTLSFNGTTQYLRYPDHDVIAPPVSVVAVIYVNATGTQTYVSYGGLGSGNGWKFGQVDDDLRFTLGSVADYTSVGALAGFIDGDRVVVGLTVGGGAARFFVNGEFVEEIAVGTMVAPTEPLWVGAAYDGTTNADEMAGDIAGMLVMPQAIPDEMHRILADDPFGPMRMAERLFVPQVATTDGQVTDAASTRIKVYGEVVDDASTRIAVQGEVTDLGSTRVAVHGQVTDLGSTRIKVHGHVTDAASTRITAGTATGQVTDVVSTRIAVHGLDTDVGSTRIAVHGQAVDDASTRVAVHGLDTDVGSTRIEAWGEVTDAASTRIALAGLDTDAASTRIQASGEVTDLGSTRVAVHGLDTDAASTRIAVYGQVTDAASTRIEGGVGSGQVTDAVSTRIEAWGEVTDAASTRVAVHGEVTDVGSTRIQLHGHVTDEGSTRIAVHGEVADAASTEIKAYSESVDAGSVRIALVGLDTDVGSTRIAVHGQVTDVGSIRLEGGVGVSEVTDAVSTRVKAHSEVTDAGSTRVKVHGHVTDVVTTRIKVYGQVTDAGSTRMALHGQVADLASTNVSLHGNVTDQASIRLEGGVGVSEVTDVVSTNIALHGHVSDVASTDISFLGDVTDDASIRIVYIVSGEVADAASVRIALAGEVADAASTEIKASSEAFEIASIRFARVNGVSRPASITMASAGHQAEVGSIRIATSDADIDLDLSLEITQALSYDLEITRSQTLDLELD